MTILMESLNTFVMHLLLTQITAMSTIMEYLGDSIFLAQAQMWTFLQMLFLIENRYLFTLKQPIVLVILLDLFLD